MTKKLTLIVAAALLTSAANAETLLYGVLLKPLSQPFWATVENGIKEATTHAQVDYYLQSVENNQIENQVENAQSQLSACNTMLERKPNVLITAAIDPEILLPCLEKANMLNIPVVDLGANLGSTAKDAGVSVAFAVDSDHEAAGAQAAEHIATVLGNDATGAVLILKGPAENKIDQTLTDSFTDRLAKTAPGLEIVASVSAGGDKPNAKTITQDILTQHSALKVIFATNDAMALGAHEATFAAGKADEIIVIGVDGNADAVDSIKQSKLHATVARFPYLMGKQAVEKTTALLAGKPISSLVTVPTMLINKEVLNTNTDPLLQFIN